MRNGSIAYYHSPSAEVIIIIFMGLVLDLQNMGKQFDLMIYPGQLHGYRGKQASFSDLSDYNFWYRHLLDKETPKVLIDALTK